MLIKDSDAIFLRDCAVKALTSTLLVRLGLLNVSEPLTPAPDLPDFLAMVGLDVDDFVLEQVK